MKFSLTGLEKGDLLIHTGDCLNRGDHMGRFDCNIKTHHVSFPFIQYTRGKWAIVSKNNTSGLK
jgi:hypothetical protein